MVIAFLHWLIDTNFPAKTIWKLGRISVQTVEKLQKKEFPQLISMYSHLGEPLWSSMFRERSISGLTRGLASAYFSEGGR